MKKTIIVTLISGRKIEKDLTNQKIAPLGSPANGDAYISLCSVYGTHGIIDPESTDKHLIYISPSQIKSVEVKFH